MMSKMIATSFLLTVGTLLWSAELELQPPPVHLAYSKDSAPLPLPVRILLPAAPSPIVLSASELLAKDFRGRFQVEAEVLHSTTSRFMFWDLESEPSVDAGTLIRLSGEKVDNAEGYALELSRDGKLVTISVKSSDIGLLYGGVTLMDVLAQSSIANNFTLSAPKKLSIYDFPAMRTRMRVSIPSDSPESIRGGLENIIRTRLNATWCKASSPTIAALVAEARKYGVKLYAQASHLGLSKELKRPLCPKNPADVALVAELFDKAAAAGCDGLVFLFDDLTGDEIMHVVKCQACANEFGDAGNTQKFWTKLMVRTGNKYGITNYIICPTPYLRNWRSNMETWGRHRAGNVFDNYYQELTDDPLLRKVLVFHCELLPEKIEELRGVGLSNYIYWINGLWPTDRWFTFSTGLTRLSWNWYCLRIDKMSGGVPIPEAMDALRHLPKLTTHVFFGTGDTAGLFLGGVWAWAPERYDETKARNAALEFTLGHGLSAEFDAFERAMMRIAAFYGGYVNQATTECSTEILNEKALATREARESRMAELQDDLRKAEVALDQARKTVASDKSNILLSPICPSYHYLSTMEASVTSARQKMAAAAARKRSTAKTKGGLAAKPPLAGTPPVGFWSFDDTSDISQNNASGGVACKIIGKPEVVDGISGKALYLHGGRFRNSDTGPVLLSGLREFAEIPFCEKLKIGTDSFSVECWVKLDDERVWNQFVGSRATAHPNYRALKGWALGMGKDGMPKFIIDDGTSTSMAAAHVAKINWTPNEWNYVVGVRDRSKGEVALYVNGAEVARCKDATNDIATGKPLYVGMDSYSGVYLGGAMDELKITGSALSTDEVMARYSMTVGEEGEKR